MADTLVIIPAFNEEKNIANRYAEQVVSSADESHLVCGLGLQNSDNNHDSWPT